jgi:hypothetical protein
LDNSKHWLALFQTVNELMIGLMTSVTRLTNPSHVVCALSQNLCVLCNVLKLYGLLLLMLLVLVCVGQKVVDKMAMASNKVEIL